MKKFQVKIAWPAALIWHTERIVPLAAVTHAMTNRHHEHPDSPQQRAQIASTAARLIAENGISDYTLAKRKAARSLGFADKVQLPGDAEIQYELQTYQRLFQDEEHTARICHLRQKAGELMLIVQRFNPYLTGSVLDGSAARYAEIDIQLFTDSAKDVEIFLLNQRIDYKHSVPRTDRAEAVLTIQSGETVANLIIYPTNQERVSFKTKDGRIRQRARLDALNDLLSATRLSSP